MEWAPRRAGQGAEPGKREDPGELGSARAVQLACRAGAWGSGAPRGQAPPCSPSPGLGSEAFVALGRALPDPL